MSWGNDGSGDGVGRYGIPPNCTTSLSQDLPVCVYPGLAWAPACWSSVPYPTHTHTQWGQRECGQAVDNKSGLAVFLGGFPIPSLVCELLQHGESYLLCIYTPVSLDSVSCTCRYLVRVISLSWFLGAFPNVNIKVLHLGNLLSSRTARMILVTLTIKEASFIFASKDMVVG